MPTRNRTPTSAHRWNSWWGRSVFKLKTTIEYYGSLAKKVDGLKDVLAATLRDAVLVWHGTSSDSAAPAPMLPKHYGTPAQVAALYPGVYAARTSRYQIRKAKKYGHQRVLEFSGDSRQAIERQISVSSTHKKAEGRMPGARVLNYSGRAGMPDMRKELLAVNEADERQLAQFIYERVKAFLEKKTPVERREIGIGITSGGSWVAR